jgi:hypothetical protein
MEPGKDYTIRAEITSIGTDKPPERIVDDFLFSVVSYEEVEKYDSTIF